MEQSMETGAPNGAANGSQEVSQQGQNNQQQKGNNGPGNVTNVQQTQPDQYEVTINGKVHKMSLQELKNSASMSHAAQSRFEEASRMRKDADRFKQLAQKDVIAALQDPSLGLTKDQIRDKFEEWYTKEYIEPETLSPEQRKIKDYEAKLKAYQEQEEEKESQRRQQEEDELTARQREHLQDQIIEALDKSGLPKTKMIASRMAFYMRENLLKGWDAPMDVIVKQVQQERQQLMNGEVNGLEGEQLVKYLGDDVVNKIRKWDLENLRKRRQNGGQKESDYPNNHKRSDEKISSQEVHRRLKEMRMGRLP